MSNENKVLIAVVALIVAVMVGLFVLNNKAAAPNSPANPGNGQLVRDNSHTLGNGKVKVVEFGDYQCPVCATAYPITKQIEKDYDGKITFVFRNFPLPMHPNAPEAAEAAEAAGAQGKYWEMHDKLYENQQAWASLPDPTDTFVGYAKDLGLDTGKFQQDVTGKAYASIISQGQADGNAYNVQGTPTFFIDGKQARDFSYGTLKGMIDDELSR